MAIEGLRIRRAEPEDAEAFYDIYSGPSAQGNTMQLPHPSLAMWRRKLADPSDTLYVLVAVVGERVVGSISISTYTRPRRRHVGGIGMGVHDEWQSQGVGTALMAAAVDLADNWLNITRLELEVFTDNERAIRLYERFGFEREGTMRQHAFRDGRYVDTHFMARLRAIENTTARDE